MTDNSQHRTLGIPPATPGGSTLPFSPAVIAGDFVFLSGQLALNAQGKAEGDVAAQAQQIFSQMRSLLREASLDLANVVKVNAWITEKEGFAEFNDAFRAAFPSRPPARSTVISDLLVPGALIEIEAIAWRGAA